MDTGEKERKEEGFGKKGRDEEEEEDILNEEGSLRSCPKLLSPEKTPSLFLIQVPNQLDLDVVCQVPFFDPDVFVSEALFSVDWRSTLSGSENDMSKNQCLEGSEEELVLGDTPPEPSVSCAGPAAHTFKGASRDFHLDMDGRVVESDNARVRSETVGVVGEVFQLNTDPDALLHWAFLDAHVQLSLLDLDAELFVLQSERRSLRLLSV